MAKAIAWYVVLVIASVLLSLPAVLLVTWYGPLALALASTLAVALVATTVLVSELISTVLDDHAC